MLSPAVIQARVATVCRPPHGARMPVIALATNTLAEHTARCFPAGRHGLVTKPTDPVDFFETLLRWPGRAS